MIDRDEILRQLDSGSEDFDFPMLDNGYYYHGDQKLTIFRDNTRWAISIEILAFNNHEHHINGISTIASVYGNCLTGWNDNSNFNYFASDDGVKTFLYDKSTYTPYLTEDARSIKVRDKRIPIIADRQHYHTKGVVLEYSDKITPWEFMRGLIPEYSNLFWLTRSELANKIPGDLPVFWTLDNWHHPDLVHNERPSSTETFRQLADGIVTGDKALYSTKEMSNTHWTNWPDGGTL